MRRFLAILLIAACAVKAFPAEHPAHRRAEDVVDAAAATAWNVGSEAVETAREALRERNRRDDEDDGDGGSDGRRSRDEENGGGEDPGGWEEFFGARDMPRAGRAALTDRLSARVDRRADRVARSAPASAERSVEALAAYLKRHAGPTMRGRTRAAFRWVAGHIAYDTNLGMVERRIRHTQSPSAVLRSREAVCAGYARLFVALAEEMGLEATQISGRADPAGPGGGGPHAWTAVRLADGWYFLDPTWAAGYVTQGRFVREWDEEWWLTPPQKFNQTHHPDEERWELGTATLATG